MEELSKSQKIRELKKHIRLEVSKFHKTNEITHLYQASEKCWMAYTLYIEKLTSEESGGYPDTKNLSLRLIKQKKIPKELFEKALWLHQFHYEGWLEDSDLVNGYIHYCLKKIRW